MKFFIVPLKRFDIRSVVFKYRSYTPIPFLGIMVYFAEPTLSSLIVGFCVVLVGEAVRFWGVSIAGSETRTTGSVGGTFLITTGPFAYVRNPLYLGNIILYAGIGIMSMALHPWLLLLAVVWFSVQYSLIVSKEEEYLATTFGTEYQDYIRHVPRFIPRLSRYVAKVPAPKRVNFGDGLVSERRTLQAIAMVGVVLVFVYILRI
jgi:protein-S-isoprenylcysteine O-methyltransferase Ste14